MSTAIGLKALHDRLLDLKPDDAEHDRSTCSLCALEVIEDTTPGGSMPEAFSQEDLDAAVSAATDPLQKRLGELEAQVQETEVGRAVAEATEAKDAEISRLQQAVDAAEAARTAAEAKLTETEQFWTDTIAAQEAAVELAARKEQRVAEATEAGVFSEDYIKDNGDRFAAMSDVDFKARMEEWRLIAAKTGKATPTPARTALVASAQPSQPDSTKVLAYIGELNERRVDPRTLGGVG